MLAKLASNCGAFVIKGFFEMSRTVKLGFSLRASMTLWRSRPLLYLMRFCWR